MESQVAFKGEYYLLGDSVYKVVGLNRANNEITVENLESGERFITPYDTFSIGYERVLKVKDAAGLLNRSPRSIYRYEAKGQIKNPNRYKTQHGERIRFYTKADILEMREMVAEIHQGRPNKKLRTVNNTTPSKYEVVTELRERYGIG